MNIKSLIGNVERFGRLVATDPRDERFLMRDILPRDISSIATREFRYWWTGVACDQGFTSQCVAYAGGHWLQAGPITNSLPSLKKEWLGSLYEECQKNDEWPGEDYDGTSVRALMKIFKMRGYISEYRWEYGANLIAAWVVEKGPVILGTDWHEGMMGDDTAAMRSDFIRVTGPSIGGHAYLVRGVNYRKKCPDGSVGAFRIMNSWGRGWMDNGFAWISFKDVDILMSNYGEAAAATEVDFKSVDN